MLILDFHIQLSSNAGTKVSARRLHCCPQDLKKSLIIKAGGVIWNNLPRVKVPEATFTGLFGEVPAQKVSIITK